MVKHQWIRYVNPQQIEIMLHFWLSMSNRGNQLNHESLIEIMASKANKLIQKI